jgi:hypothetical protein
MSKFPGSRKVAERPKCPFYDEMSDLPVVKGCYQIVTYHTIGITGTPLSEPIT